MKRRGNINDGNSRVVYWVIGFIFLSIIIIWTTAYFIGLSNQAASNGSADDKEIMARQQNNALVEYVSYVKDIDKRASIDLSVTANGLLKLSDALRELGGSSVEGNAKLIEGHANKIMKTNDNLLSSKMAGEAFISAADALNTIQENKIPGAEKDVLRVSEAAQSYDKDKAIFEQKVKVKEFFDLTAKVINEANKETEKPS